MLIVKINIIRKKPPKHENKLMHKKNLQVHGVPTSLFDLGDMLECRVLKAEVSESNTQPMTLEHHLLELA